MNNKNVTELMQTRHSARKFLLDFELTKEQIAAIIEAGRMSPTSYGLQNFRIINLFRGTLRKELGQIFYNQTNFTDASNFFLLISDTGEKLRHKTIQVSAKAMMGDSEDDDKILRFIANFEGGFDKKFQGNTLLADQWSCKSVYVAAGIMTVAAAELDIDTCIMEGFDIHALNTKMKLLGFIEADEMIYLGMAFGKIDHSALKKQTYKKIRRNMNEFYKEIK